MGRLKAVTKNRRMAYHYKRSLIKLIERKEPMRFGVNGVFINTMPGVGIVGLLIGRLGELYSNGLLIVSN